MLVVSLVAQSLFLLVSLTISARATLHAKSVVRGGLYLYGLLVLGTVLFCVVLPGALGALGVDHHRIARAFPEAIGVPAVVFACWIPAFGFAGLVRIVARKLPNSPNGH